MSDGQSPEHEDQQTHDKYLERIAQLETPEACEIFARNAEEKDRPDLAVAAKRRAVELRAEQHSANTPAEKEALQAVYAYEETLFKKHGRRIRASRTWQMIDDHGLIKAVERAVDRPEETQGYRSLADMGLLEFAFEKVVLRHPHAFTDATVERAEQRVAEWDTKE